MNTRIHKESLHGLSLVYSASLSLVVLRQPQDKPFDRLRINPSAVLRINPSAVLRINPSAVLRINSTAIRHTTQGA